MPSTWGIVVAAGRGERFTRAASGGSAAKQFAELDGARVVDRAVQSTRDACDGVVLVLGRDVAWDGSPVDAVVLGGAERADSVRAGLAAVPDDAEVVVVHDA